MEGSRIDLKTFLGLAKPNQSAGFWVIISGQNPQTFMIPIYSTTVLYDKVKQNKKLVVSIVYTVILSLQLRNTFISSSFSPPEIPEKVIYKKKGYLIKNSHAS